MIPVTSCPGWNEVHFDADSTSISIPTIVWNTALVLEMKGGRNLLVITGEATNVDIQETTCSSAEWIKILQFIMQLE
jgi:hypothetical protein